MALVLQRLLLTLAVPPLLVLGTPRPAHRPPDPAAAVDAVLRVAVRPVPAVAIVTVVAVGTLTVGAVSLAAHSIVARVVIELVVLASGFVLWAPVLTELPGRSASPRWGAAAISSCSRSCRASSPSSGSSPATRCTPPSPTRAPSSACRPLLDQELAGFLAKLSTIAVLWTVAFVIMTRAQTADTAGEDTEPLMWSDVEREIERAERRERRQPWWPGAPPSGS